MEIDSAFRGRDSCNSLLATDDWIFVYFASWSPQVLIGKLEHRGLVLRQETNRWTHHVTPADRPL